MNREDREKMHRILEFVHNTTMFTTSAISQNFRAVDPLEDSPERQKHYVLALAKLAAKVLIVVLLGGLLGATLVRLAPALVSMRRTGHAPERPEHSEAARAAISRIPG